MDKDFGHFIKKKKKPTFTKKVKIIKIKVSSSNIEGKLILDLENS